MADINSTKKKVLGYPIDLVNEERSLDLIEDSWRRGKPMHIITLNAEMTVSAQKDHALDSIIRKADLVIPDGAGIVFALRLSGARVNRLPGIELASGALHRAACLGKRVALLGGKESTLALLKQKLKALHPGLNIVAAQHGYFKMEEETDIVQRMAAANPDLVLVALGAPKQEYFISRWRGVFPFSVMIGVGGSFDIWAGSTKRAPLPMRRFHLEWLYRLIKEPWRLRRIGSALPAFAAQVLWHRLCLCFQRETED